MPPFEQKGGVRLIYSVAEPMVFQLCELFCRKPNRKQEEHQGAESLI